MAGIFTRKTLSTIINDENLTPEERVDQIFALYGRAVDSGYIARSTADAEKQAAVEAALAGVKPAEPQPINVQESDEYKQLQAQFDSFKTRTEASSSDDFKAVKPKFFDAVYDRLDHGEKHKPYAEQLGELQKDFEEYFDAPAQPEQTDPQKPQFGAPTTGTMPKGQGKTFADYWGYKKQT